MLKGASSHKFSRKEEETAKGGGEMPFVGEYNHTLDAKNRVFMPAKFREQLGEAFYVTRKMNKNCLAVYSESEMEKISEMINRFPDSEVSEIKTFLFSKTVYVTPDTNGRVVLIPSILSYAQIEKNVVIVGVGNHVEIWSDSLWEREESERNLESIRSKLASIGL